jgi:hypothetical protein
MVPRFSRTQVTTYFLVDLLPPRPVEWWWLDGFCVFLAFLVIRVRPFLSPFSSTIPTAYDGQFQCSQSVLFLVIHTLSLTKPACYSPLATHLLIRLWSLYFSGVDVDQVERIARESDTSRLSALDQESILVSYTSNHQPHRPTISPS